MWIQLHPLRVQRLSNPAVVAMVIVLVCGIHHACFTIKFGLTIVHAFFTWFVARSWGLLLMTLHHTTLHDIVDTVLKSINCF